VRECDRNSWHFENERRARICARVSKGGRGREKATCRQSKSERQRCAVVVFVMIMRVYQKLVCAAAVCEWGGGGIVSVRAIAVWVCARTALVWVRI